MPDFYAYLAASLPMLRFKAKPPFSFSQFIAKCRGLIPGKDLEILKRLDSESPLQDSPVIRQWQDFQRRLGNELVKVRASRKKIDPAKYLRQDGYAPPYFYHIALAAQRNASPQEAEIFLDQARWDFLDELGFGHYFDLELLIIYAYKLLILERWERVGSADKDKELAQALS